MKLLKLLSGRFKASWNILRIKCKWATKRIGCLIACAVSFVLTEPPGSPTYAKQAAVHEILNDFRVVTTSAQAKFRRRPLRLSREHKTVDKTCSSVARSCNSLTKTVQDEGVKLLCASVEWFKLRVVSK